MIVTICIAYLVIGAFGGYFMARDTWRTGTPRHDVGETYKWFGAILFLWPIFLATIIVAGIGLGIQKAFDWRKVPAKLWGDR